MNGRSTPIFYITMCEFSSLEEQKSLLVNMGIGQQAIEVKFFLVGFLGNGNAYVMLMKEILNPVLRKLFFVYSRFQVFFQKYALLSSKPKQLIRSKYWLLPMNQIPKSVDAILKILNYIYVPTIMRQFKT